jgi:hypothetical protein
MTKSKTPLDLTLYTKSGKLRKRKPKQQRNYFTEDTENAILDYVASEDQVFRNKIYNEKIHNSFYKLAENIIHTFKFYYNDLDNDVEALKHEVITFLLQKLQFYKKDRGKAYSYFGTITKRYLINYNNTIYKKIKKKGSLEEVDEDKTVFVSLINEGVKDDSMYFLEKYLQYVEANKGKYFSKEIDQNTVNAVIQLFQRAESIDVMNKQAFYLYVKEITGNTAPQITKVIKVLKELYVKLMNQYYLDGDIDV